MKMIKQRLMGVGLVAITVFIVLLASTGTTDEDRDATAALLTGPLGVYMIVTKEYVLYDGEPIEPDPQDAREISTYRTRHTTRKESPHGKKKS